MKEIIKILLIEDSPEDERFVEIQLTKSFGNAYTLQTRDFFSKALQLLKENTFDIIILDLSLPDGDGLNTFNTLVKSCNTPIIVYTGLENETIKAETIKAGAKDYLIKGKTTADDLKNSINNGIKK